MKLKCEIGLVVISLLVSSIGWSQEISQSEEIRDHVAVLVRGSGAGSDKAASMVAHFLRKAVVEDTEFAAVSLVGVLGNASMERSRLDFKEADDFVSRGQKAYQEFELDQTMGFFKEALTRYERNVGYIDDFTKLSELLMLMGAVHSLRGERKRAALRFVQAYTVDDEVEPDPSVFNPSMREQFRRAIERLNRRPRGSLALTSNPSYGEVYLNGEFVGVTPLVLEGLLEGKQYVQIGRDGFRNWGGAIQIKGRRESAENARLDPTEYFDRFDKLLEGIAPSMSELISFGDTSVPDDDVPEPVEEVGALLNADQVFWAGVRLDGEQVRLSVTQINLNGRSTEDKWVKTASLVFSYDSQQTTYEREIGAFYKKYFSSGVSLSSDSSGQRESAGSNLIRYGDELCLGMACATFKKVVFGVGVGGGLALMGAGSLFWSQATEYNDIYRGNSEETQPSQISDEAQELRNKGEPLAVVGDLFFGLGAAVTVGTVVWTLLYEPAPTPDDVMEGTSGGWGFSIGPYRDGGMLTGQVRF